MLTTATVLSRIRNAIGDFGTAPNQSFTDAELKDHLDETVLEYSAYRPVQKRTTFNTVANQDIYDLSGTAPDVAWIDRVYTINNAYDLSYFFNTTGIYSTIDAFSFLRYMRIGDRNLFTIRDDLLDLYAELGRPVAEAYNGNQVILYPAPSVDGLVMQVDYSAVHVVDGNGNYPTIRSQDQTYILRLLEARLLDIFAVEFIKKGNYSQGQTKMQFDATTFQDRARSLRDQVINVLSEGFVGRG